MMQPPTVSPRESLTTGQVVDLVQNAGAVTLSVGCELLDLGLNVLEDLGGDFRGGSVTRAAYADMHGSATLYLTRRLDWGTAIVRPYLTMSDQIITARFNLGAYYTSVPEWELGSSPSTYEVTGCDLLHILADPVGEAYAVAEGVGYLDAVETILQGRGITRYLIDQTAVGSVLPTDRVWPLDERTTWLTVINDLLGSISYLGIWTDWDGVFRVAPYERPSERAAEWVYDTGSLTSMLGPRRNVKRDYYLAPNRWIAVRNNNVDAAPPTEGNGKYTYVNQFDGPTSVEARGGRVITKFIPVEAADQTALVARAQQTIDADMRLKATLAVTTYPNPLHWHFDRLYIVDPAADAPMDVVGTRWTLPLDGSMQTHEWSVL